MNKKTNKSRSHRSSLLAELSQHQGYASTATGLARIFRQFKAGTGFEHPVLDSIRSNPLSSGPILMFDLQRIEQRMRELNQLASEFSATVLLAVKSCPDA